jgi:hypothetical protein
MSPGESLISAPAGWRQYLRRAIYGFGLVVVLVSVGFVLQRIYTTRIWEIDPATFWRIFGATLAGSIVYGVASLQLSFAWWRLLVWCNETEATASTCHAIFGRAQIIKYVPGNIFSFVARHYLGRRAGFSHRSLAWATVLETVGVIFASGCLAMAGIGAWSGLGLGLSAAGLILALLSLLLLPLAVTRLVSRMPSLASYTVPHKHSKDFFIGLLPIYFLYVGFFMVSGLALWAVVQATSGAGAGPGPIALVAVMAATWVVGYVTPGASAGVGVRDALLILALSQYLSEADSVYATVAFRFLTVIGDIIFFGLAHFFPLPEDATAAAE